MKVHETREQELPATTPARVCGRRPLLEEQEAAMVPVNGTVRPRARAEQDVPVDHTWNLWRIRRAARALQSARGHAEQCVACRTVGDHAVVGAARSGTGGRTCTGLPGIASNRNGAGTGTEIERRPVRPIPGSSTHAHRRV